LIDWAIVAFYLGITTVGGLLCEQLIRGSIAHFVVAGRQIRKFLLAAAGSAAEVGLIAVMYLAEEAYAHGLSALMLPVLILATQAFIGFTGFCIVRYRQTGAITMGHYAEMRYSGSFRIFSGLFQFLAVLLTISMFPIVGGAFITYFLGLPANFEFLGLTLPTVPLVTAALLVPVIAYTMAGGTVSVAFTDYMQFVMAWVAMVIVTVLVLADCSWGRIVGAVHQTYGALGFNPLLQEGKRGYGLYWLLFMVLQYIYGSLVWPPINLRVSSSKEPKAARQMYVIMSALHPGRCGMLMLWGLAALVMVPAAVISLEHLPAGYDRLVRMPYYLGTIMPPVVLGLFAAGMLAAEMSNVSAYFMATSAVATQDILFPCLGKHQPSSQAKVTIHRLVILVLAVFAFVWGLLYGLNTTLFTYLMMSGAVYSPGAGAFLTLGLYWKRANVVGAYGAMVAGGILPLICIFTKFDNPNTQFILAFLAYVVAFGAMVAGSLIGERFGVKPELATEAHQTVSGG
jgi:Na+/proline symporter